MDKMKEKEGDRKEARRILSADGVTDPTARTLAEDFTDSEFRATLIRNNPPQEKQAEKGKENVRDQPRTARQIHLLLLKSPRNSWLIQFQDPGVKGTASIADRETFHKALIDLLV